MEARLVYTLDELMGAVRDSDGSLDSILTEVNKRVEGDERKVRSALLGLYFLVLQGKAKISFLPSGDPIYFENFEEKTAATPEDEGAAKELGQ